MAVELSKPQIDIGMVTTDLDRALRFYRDILGFEEAGAVDLPGIGHIHRLKCGETLFRIVVPANPPERTAHTGGYDAETGLRYMTLMVRNLAEIVSAAETAGYPVPFPPMQLRPGTTSAQISDGQGITIELTQIDPAQ
ncbi:VOC family protein [Sphingomonas sp. C3-2]|uniref:VOC family protein n=1 Tax=Sphingomonas sp. C3-2 TaxID=3062169 RepID=UPI00294B6C0A|nr:VOC family protein [Sphingomonas sp. C3-2]WOK36713.1 VOC family protein [Sphingomonas sp. C3-2]